MQEEVPIYGIKDHTCTKSQSSSRFYKHPIKATLALVFFQDLNFRSGINTVESLFADRTGIAKTYFQLGGATKLDMILFVNFEKGSNSIYQSPSLYQFSQTNQSSFRKELKNGLMKNVSSIKFPYSIFLSTWLLCLNKYLISKSEMSYL